MVDELRRGAGSLQPNGTRMHEDVMPVEAVADSVVHMASLPLHVNILTQVGFSSVSAVRDSSLTACLSPLSSSSSADDHGQRNAVCRPWLNFVTL